MSLKGYQWLIDNKVVMTFTFKRLELDVWEDVSITELEEFKKFIIDKGYHISKIEIHKPQEEKQDI